MQKLNHRGSFTQNRKKSFSLQQAQDPEQNEGSAPAPPCASWKAPETGIPIFKTLQPWGRQRRAGDALVIFHSPPPWSCSPRPCLCPGWPTSLTQVPWAPCHVASSWAHPMGGPSWRKGDGTKEKVRRFLPLLPAAPAQGLHQWPPSQLCCSISSLDPAGPAGSMPSWVAMLLARPLTLLQSVDPRELKSISSSDH